MTIIGFRIDGCNGLKIECFGPVPRLKIAKNVAEPPEVPQVTVDRFPMLQEDANGAIVVEPVKNRSPAAGGDRPSQLHLHRIVAVHKDD